MTFNELAIEAVIRAFPEGVANELKDIHRKRLRDGLIALQHYVPELNQRHHSLIGWSKTYYQQGASVVPKPPGIIKRVCTFTSKTFNDFVWYYPIYRPEFDRLIQQRARFSTYPNTVPALPGLFPSSSEQNKGYRAERGVFCIDGQAIKLIPHLESGEHVMIEWEGIQRVWGDDEPLGFNHLDVQIPEIMAAHLTRQSAMFDTKMPADAATALTAYQEALRRLAIDAKEEREPDEPVEDLGGLPRTCLPVPIVGGTVPECFDESMPFFTGLYIYCPDDGLYYKFINLVLDEEVVTGTGENVDGGEMKEATFQTLRADRVLIESEDGEGFYPTNIFVGSGNLGHESTDPAPAGSNKVLENVRIVNLDLKDASSSTGYRRVTVRLVDGEPTLQVNEAPEGTTTLPYLQCDIVEEEITYLKLKDQLDGLTKKLSIYDGAQAVAVSALPHEPAGNSVPIRDVTTGVTMILTIYNGATAAAPATQQYVTAPDRLRFTDRYTGLTKYLKVADSQIIVTNL